MIDHSGLVRSSALAVRVASLANRCFLLAVVLGLIASWLLAEQFTTILLGSDTGSDLGATTIGMRYLMGLGVVMAGAIYVLLQALREMIATVSLGDPFIAANAGRLRTIGWCLLTLQLLDIPAAVIARAFPSLGAAAPDGGVSLGGWIAVLMVFVLARIFVAGATLRDELEGTV